MIGAGREVGWMDDEVLAGFRTAHHRTGVNLLRTLEATASVVALTEVLVAKGIIGLDEVDRARRAAEERLNTAFADAGLTVALTEGARDKYSMGEAEVSIDCEARRPMCRSACCRLRFALTAADVDEGIVRWSLGEPYLNRQDPSGWCTHIERDGSCDVYAHRPSVCRSYDCRKDQRIWADFGARVISDDLAAAYAELDAQQSPPVASSAVSVPWPTVRDGG